MAKGITPDSLLHGALYALRQSAYLLNDAILLSGAGRAPTAAGLALLAREELGRFRLLLRMRKDAIESGKCPSMDEVKKFCKDHRVKQQWGQTAVSVGLPDDWSDQLMAKLKQNPEEEERILKDAFRPIEVKRARDPHIRHLRRGECFYVDVKPSGDWNHPWLMSKAEAERIIVDAKSDYHMMLYYIRGEPKTLGPKLERALDAWADKPELPFIVWKRDSQSVSPECRTDEQLTRPGRR
jgi:AbiV family abortive infection protein